MHYDETVSYLKALI